MTEKPLVYLAGVPTDWRENVTRAFDHRFEFIDPVSSVEEDGEQLRARTVLPADLRSIRDCDVVLVRWEMGSLQSGTTLEIAYAVDQCDLPVVVWLPEAPREETEQWVAENIREDIWGDASAITPTIEAAISEVESLSNTQTEEVDA